MHLWKCDNGTYDVCNDEGVIYQNVPEHVLAAAPELIAALEQWKCPACGGSGTYEHFGNKGERERTGMERGDHPQHHFTPCKKCEGSGLHPVAHAAITKAKQEKA